VRNRWYEVMRAQGVSETDCARLAGAFVYPGFSADPHLVLARA
jgi:hypothetical protein